MIQFLDAKSVISAACMGYVTAGTSMFFFCHSADAHCTGQSLRTRSLCLAILYQFFRETSCDVRDIAEDKRDGMKTLPVRLGKSNTLLLMVSLGALLDTVLTSGLSMDWSGIQMDPARLVGSVLRVGVTIGTYSIILHYPRRNMLAWGMMSLLGLVPVLWAQGTLLESN